MNQEIKFRAWDKDMKLMRTVRHIQFNTGPLEITVQDGSQVPCHLIEREFVLMQFSGVKDDSGKDIYDGDVVEGKLQEEHHAFIGYHGEEVSKFLVRWDYDGFTWETLGKDKRFVSGVHIEDKKVIGNIYDNPELLK